MNKKELYQSKVVSMQEALSKIQSNDVVAASSFLNEPVLLLDHLHTIASRVEGVRVWTQTTVQEYPYMADASLKGRVDLLSNFYAGGVREAHLQERATIMPSNLHYTGREMVKCRDVNVFMAAVAPMDEHGYVYLSGSLSVELDLLEAAQLVIFEVNPNIPVIYGNTPIPIEKADYIVEVEYPLTELKNKPMLEHERRIGNYIAELIDDGDCIQLGIGNMPDAAGEMLMDKKDLGIHTELITPVMGKLIEAGVVTNERKNFHKGKTLGGIVWPDHALYKTLDHNATIDLRPCSYVNDPVIIMQNDHMVSVNSAIQIDLTGQVCSETMGYRQFSGTGGAFDFAFGAYRSKGGKGIIAIPSTAKGGTVSRIMPLLSHGAVVSISRNVVDHVVTEYGIARLRHKTIGERVRELIAIAHPDFRDDLKKQAQEYKLW